MICLGSIVKPKSYSGMMRVSNVPTDILPLAKGTKVLIGYSEKFANEYSIKEWRCFGKTAEVVLNEVDSDVEVKKLSEHGIFADEKDVHYKKTDEIKANELIGLEVFDIHDKYIGKIAEVWKLPANDVWLVGTDNGELPIPVIDEVVKEINLKSKRITIEMIPGLSELSNNDGDHDA